MSGDSFLVHGNRYQVFLQGNRGDLCDTLSRVTEYHILDVTGEKYLENLYLQQYELMQMGLL
jgi:hypothetical protein